MDKSPSRLANKLLCLTILIPSAIVFLFLMTSSPALPAADTATSDCTKPALMVDYKYMYWASAADYAERKLTVVTWLKNNGVNDVYNVVINDSIPDNGVTLESPVPVTVGNIASGQRGAPFTMIYKLPLFVSDFQTIFATSAEDACGNSYSYNLASQNHATILPDEIT